MSHIVSLESVIQKVENKDIPTTKEDWNIYCLDMVNDFGFLNINKYVKSSYGFFDYEKEHIVKWKSFANLKNIIQNKDIDKIEVMNSYLQEELIYILMSFILRKYPTSVILYLLQLCCTYLQTRNIQRTV